MSVATRISRLGPTRIARAPGQLALSVFGLTTLVLVAVLGRLLVPFDPHQVGAGPTLLSPLSGNHLLGTDELGRDVLSRVVTGLGVTLLVGIVSALFATAIGVLVGAVAGYVGGRTDDLLMRVAEVFLIIPQFFLGVVLVSILGPSLVNLILTISLLGWPVTARVVRAEVLTLRARSYVDAARVIGVGRWRLLATEILPNAQAPILIAGALQAGQAMLLEASLSYLGLGYPNQVSLGLMLQQAQPILRSGWWVAVTSGLGIFFAILCVNLLADGIRYRLDARLRPLL